MAGIVILGIVGVIGAAAGGLYCSISNMIKAQDTIDVIFSGAKGVILGSIGGFFGSMFLFLATIAAISGFQSMVQFLKDKRKNDHEP